MKKNEPNFLSFLGAPAQRTLMVELKISQVEDISRYSKKDLLKLHGFGPSSIPKIEEALKKIGKKLKD